MKDDERLAQIRERAKKTTPGPWYHVFGLGGGISTATEQVARVNAQRPPLAFEHDAAFIAHARQDIPWLLARIDKLETLIPDAEALERIADNCIPLEYARASRDLSSYAAAIREFKKEQGG